MSTDPETCPRWRAGFLPCGRPARFRITFGDKTATTYTCSSHLARGVKAAFEVTGREPHVRPLPAPVSERTPTDG